MAEGGGFLNVTSFVAQPYENGNFDTISEHCHFRRIVMKENRRAILTRCAKAKRNFTFVFS